MISPLWTRRPLGIATDDRYELDTLMPGIGSIVTVFIPATEPAKVTVPEAGATTVVPGAAAKSTPQ